MTQGETVEEALFNASEVLTLTMEYRLDQEQEIPEPSNMTGKNIYLISPEENPYTLPLNNHNKRSLIPRLTLTK